MSGWRVPGYTELGELGAGAHGRVVLARRGEAEAPGAIEYVAIKYVDTGDPTAPRVPSDHEARLMASVEHPNVVRLHDLVQGETGIALVMEAVEGVSLARLLEERTGLEGHAGLEAEAALAVLKGSLLGLAAAHAAGVVHRDYKPGNVIVGGDGVSKLIDFGVAAVSGDRSVAGTAAYMAPEQCNGDPAGPAADVYAATCVFVECVAGRPPYLGDRELVLMAQHLHGAIPAELVPRALRGLVTHGMAKSPADRPPGAAEFVRELEAVAVEAYGADWERHGLAVLAAAALALHGGGTGPAQAGTSVADTTIGDSAAGPAGTGAAAGVGAAAALPSMTASVRDAATEQARRSVLPALLVLCAALVVLIGAGLYVLRDDSTTQGVAFPKPTGPPASSPPASSAPTPRPGKTGGSDPGGGGGRQGGPATVPAGNPGHGPFDRPSDRPGTPCAPHAIEPYNFGSVQVGQAVARDFTFPRRACDDVRAMSVEGPGAAGFGAPVLLACAPHGARSPCRFRVTFRPTERGRLYRATVVVPSAGGGTAVTLRLTGAASPPVQSCPRQALPVRNLGSTEVGRTISGVLDVTWNDCYDASELRLEGDPSFRQAGSRCQAGPCRIAVTFSPVAAGTRSAILVIPDRSGETAVTVPLTAAAAPVCRRGAQGPPHRFGGATDVGERSEERVAVPWDSCYDAGTMSLTDTSAFTLLEDTSCPVEAGASCAVPVAFEPRSSGTFSAKLVVRDRDGGVGVSVRITATAGESCRYRGESEVEGAEVDRTVERRVAFRPPPCFADRDITYRLEGHSAFRLTGAGCSSGEGTSCELTFSFTPREETRYTATVVMRDEKERAVGTYTVSALGLPPEDEGEPCTPDPSDGCPAPAGRPSGGGSSHPSESPGPAKPPGPPSDLGTPKTETPEGRPSTPEPHPSTPEPDPSTPGGHGDSGTPKTPKASDGPAPEKPASSGGPESERPGDPDEPSKPAPPHQEPSTAPQPKAKASGRVRAVPTTS
ncbi:serine/threonine-protein kinase [Actinomadura mexicana]|uniref:non-specific serine/threonine protein kinase n=1 Tax=Actinomadura mexicana TaxID=134959 RepID=A0A238VPK2_9ACTN|nr:serine/threonine-protein kinase [Actinomadura mexicana]SNR36138.1 Serine/threonine protein kinase [Actinomadura mexicana]